MDRDLSVEKHLMSRCYTSEKQILELLELRYQTPTIPVPILHLTPAESIEETPKKETGALLTRNAELKPTASRKISTRRDLRVYLKSTLARQKKAVGKLQQSVRQRRDVSIELLLQGYQVPVYEKYLPLNAMWKKYMLDLLFGDQKNPNLNMLLPKLSTADYNGCHLSVLESRDRNLIGISGIVLYDAQHSFVLVTPQQTHSERTLSPAERIGGLRIVSKKASLFGFEVDVNSEEVLGFTILGSRFALRSVDRSSKKFKSHNVEDIY